MRTLTLLLSTTLVLACSSPSESPPDAPDGTDPPSTGCLDEVGVTRTHFVAESIAYLRSTFAVTTGFETGSVAYGEAWVSLSDGPCPLADWTALSYVVPIEPSLVPVELRDSVDRVAAVWALNGRRYVAFLPTDAPAGDAAPWLQGRMPDNVNAVARPGAHASDLTQIVSTLREDPALTVTWLEEIGILTVESAIGTYVDEHAVTTTVPHMTDAAARIRTSTLFDSIEWSGFVVRWPFESWAAAPVTSEEIGPECLRTHTRSMHDKGMFTTTPSLAAPLGNGIVPHAPTCE